MPQKLMIVTLMPLFSNLSRHGRWLAGTIPHMLNGAVPVQHDGHVIKMWKLPVPSLITVLLGPQIQNSVPRRWLRARPGTGTLLQWEGAYALALAVNESCWKDSATTRDRMPNKSKVDFVLRCMPFWKITGPCFAWHPFGPPANMLC